MASSAAVTLITGSQLEVWVLGQPHWWDWWRRGWMFGALIVPDFTE